MCGTQWTTGKLKTEGKLRSTGAHSATSATRAVARRTQRKRRWPERTRGHGNKHGHRDPVAHLNKPFCSLSAQSSTPSVATAAASSCAGSRVMTSQSDTELVASPTAALKWDLEGVEAQLRGLADSRARVEAELLRITCEETFLRRQQRRPLHGIFAAKNGEDANAAECSPEVEVTSGLAPTGLHVSGSHNLFSGWIDKLNCFFILGVTPCAPDFHQVSRRS